MCGRFFIDASKDLNDLLDALDCQRKEKDIADLYNIAPTDRIPVIIHNRGENRIFNATWWFTPSWSPNPQSRKYSMFNAKSETLEQSKAFSESYHHKRCLIPATGFIEWVKSSNGKQPLEIRHPDRPLLLGGIYDVWQQKLLSCAIVTTQSDQTFEHIHHRMPVMIKPDQAQAWLDATSDIQQIKNMMQPQLAHSLKTRVIDDSINDAKKKIRIEAQTEWQLIG